MPDPLQPIEFFQPKDGAARISSSALALLVEPSASVPVPFATAGPGRWIGVDVGLNGAVACLDATADGAVSLQIYDMPTLQSRPARRGSKNRTGRRSLDVAAVVALFGELAAPMLIDGRPVVATIEQVSARPGEGVVSSRTFGRCYGVTEAAVAAAHIPVTTITPHAWKRALSVPAAKDRAVRRADELMPAAALRRRPQRHSSRARSGVGAARCSRPGSVPGRRTAAG